MLSDYFVPWGGRSIAISVYVGYACLFGHIFHKTICPNQTSRKFLYLLLVVVTRSSSDDRYVLPVPVLRTTSCFHTIRHLWCTARLMADGCQREERRDGQSFNSLALPITVTDILGNKPRRTQRSLTVPLWRQTVRCARRAKSAILDYLVLFGPPTFHMFPLPMHAHHF